MLAHFGYTQVKMEAVAAVDQTIRETRENRERIENLDVQKLRQQLAEEAYQNALKQFQAKWGESPTDSEKAILKARVYRGVGAEIPP